MHSLMDDCFQPISQVLSNELILEWGQLLAFQKRVFQYRRNFVPLMNR